MAGKRNDDIEVARRINTVMRLLTEGISTYDICQQMAEQTGCSQRQAERYIRKARETITEQWSRIDRKEMAASILNKLELVYQRSLEHRQYSASQAALACQSKIVGIDSPKG